MKKFATLAVLAAISTVASAQSSVTLFGVIDASARYVKNGDVALKSLGSSGLNSSRLGFRGVEDLGSGLKAGFWLESGLNIDTGSASDTTRFFNRRSTVSLMGNFGEIRLGRDITPTYAGYLDFDPYGNTGIAASGKFDSNLGTARDTAQRADNQITYFLPNNIGGVYGRASVAAGEGTVGKKYVGGLVGYAAGPLNVSVNYGVTEVAPLLGDDKFKVMGFGTSYDFNAVKVMGYYSASKFVDQELARYAVAAIVPFGLHQITAGYTRANAKGRNAANASVDANDADQFVLGYAYNLSKRTALYGTGVLVKNKAAASFVATGGPTLLAGTERKSTGAEVGIRHSF